MANKRKVKRDPFPIKKTKHPFTNDIVLVVEDTFPIAQMFACSHCGIESEKQLSMSREDREGGATLYSFQCPDCSKSTWYIDERMINGKIQ